MYEKFNFYMLVSEDEIVSEKLVGMLIPECNQVEGMILLVKPFSNPERSQEY